MIEERSTMVIFRTMNDGFKSILGYCILTGICTVTLVPTVSVFNYSITQNVLV